MANRKYYRKCGFCGSRHEQSDMVRTDGSPNGWMCRDCHDKGNKVINSKNRKYYRKCGFCGNRYEQSEMIRTDESENGWMCHDCYEQGLEVIEPEWDDGYSENGY